MKNKRIIIFLIFSILLQSIFAHDESPADKLTNLGNEHDYYDQYSLKESLTASDCENLEFIKWLFEYESGIEINDKNIELIKTNYLGGVPVQITELPYYYKINLSNSEYKQLKKALKKNDNWEISKDDKISLLLVTKFYLGCVIKEKELIFGFSNMNLIRP